MRRLFRRMGAMPPLGRAVPQAPAWPSDGPAAERGDAGTARRVPADDAYAYESVRRRLLLWLLPMLVATLVVTSIVDYRTTLSRVVAAYDQALGDAALALAGNLRVEGVVLKLELSERAVRVLQLDSTDKVFFRVIGPAGDTVAGEANLPPPRAGGGRHAYDEVFQGQAIRMVSYPVTTTVGECQVLVAETTRKRDDARREILWTRMVSDLLILVVTVQLVWLAVGAALGPLRRLALQVQQRSGDDLRPLPEGGVPSEVQPLVKALNRLFEMIGEAQDGQRRFIENAAHQLRTPLAGLRGQMELAVAEARTVLAAHDDPRAGSVAERLERVQLAANRLTHLANQLLTLARSDRPSHDSASRQQVSLPDLVDEVVSALLDAALARQQDLGAETEPVLLRAVSWELREVLSNLIDNAIRYTPPGGRITVRCGQDGGDAWLEVEDNGPGIPASERLKVFERFYRLPDSPAGGSGLGLAIVKEIAALSSGRVEILDARTGPGTRVRVSFPMAARGIPPG